MLGVRNQPTASAWSAWPVEKVVDQVASASMLACNRVPGPISLRSRSSTSSGASSSPCFAALGRLGLFFVASAEGSAAVDSLLLDSLVAGSEEGDASEAGVVSCAGPVLSIPARKSAATITDADLPCKNSPFIRSLFSWRVRPNPMIGRDYTILMTCTHIFSSVGVMIPRNSVSSRISRSSQIDQFWM